MNDKDAMSQEDLDAVIKQTMSEAEAAVEGAHPRDNASGSTANPESSDPEPELESRVVELQTEADGLRDKWLRAVADLENYKKRTKREVEEATHRATQDLLGSFLPVADNLERALEAAGDSADDFVKGVRMVATEFYAALSRHGIEAVEAVGKPFDPSMHDALQQIDSPDHAPGTVVLEFERGYTRGNRLLRPARVVVAGAGSGTNLSPEEPSAGEKPTNE